MLFEEFTEGLRNPADNPCWKGYHPVGTKQKGGRTVPNCVPRNEDAGNSTLSVGDPVIITGNVEYQGRTGDVRQVGRDGAFVVVDLYNYGPHSFHASDVSLNDYADSDDEAEYQRGVAEGSKEDFENWKKTVAPKAAQSAIQNAVNVRAQKQAVAKSITQNDINRALAKKGVAEQDQVGNMPAERFDSAMARLKQLAGAGPLKTVWDPQKRVYKNVPTAVQPKK